MNLFSLVTKLEAILQEQDFKFSPEGYPIIPKENLISEVPEDIEMYPLSKRHQTPHPEHTILCAYENDSELYRFLRNFKRNIEDCRKYYGVCGFDLSPRASTDESHQRFNLLLNALINAYMALNGIHILPNWRTGNLNTLEILNIYPVNSVFAVGCLGCGKRNFKENEIILRMKLLISRPKFLIYYGSLRKRYRKILEEIGIPYRILLDYRTRSYRRTKDRKETKNV